MNRLISSLLLSATVLVAAVPQAFAAGDTVIAPGTPPLTRDVADSTAEFTVFLLQVVATGDADDSPLDRTTLDGWASALAGQYAGMSTEEQLQLALMPTLNTVLHAAWDDASDDDRDSVREAFRPLAEGWLGGMACDGFVSLADAGLVEPTSAHLNRYRQCNTGAGSTVTPAPSAPVAASAPSTAPIAAGKPTSGTTSSGASPSGSTTSTPSMSPTAAAQRASQGLLASHNMYVNMSNALLENHVGNMNAILNMGNNDYHYVYTPHP